ncbi:MAG TPA: tRNA epoxyqueuosine(34) reductase QueG [Bryobacteraceae bacterium]|jgi:epoxyqueuosine reductase|nr:tRNA epoxyqueuosine(34) reductase QueG [Bryobacteraceae bacterium]
MVNSRIVRHLAAKCGFSLAGIVRPVPAPDFGRFRNWADRGLAGEMRYLTDHRAEVRSDPGQLLPGLKSIICVGLVYNGPEPYSVCFAEPERAWISRYAWGDDYHGIIRAKLASLRSKLLEIEQFESRICVDTAPLLERSLANRAGLGWIGKNTCLINQQLGSWFFLGELLTTLDLEPEDTTPADRCGNCTRCIDACPTAAIVPSPDGRFELDAKLCISYFTIELRTAIPEEQRAAMGAHVFGCDICQDVCPWNRRAAETNEPNFQPREFAPELERLASITEAEFRDMFHDSPVSRAKYRGFLRNVAVAMGNARLEKFREPLQKLAASEDPLVAEHAQWALTSLDRAQSPAR